MFFTGSRSGVMPRRGLPEDQVGLGAGRDPAEVVAAERPGAAERRGVEDVGGGRASVWRSTILDTTAAQRIASITLWGFVSVPRVMLTPRAR